MPIRKSASSAGTINSYSTRGYGSVVVCKPVRLTVKADEARVGPQRPCRFRRFVRPLSHRTCKQICMLIYVLASSVNTLIDHSVFQYLHVPVVRCSASCVSGSWPRAEQPKRVTMPLSLSPSSFVLGTESQRIWCLENCLGGGEGFVQKKHTREDGNI